MWWYALIGVVIFVLLAGWVVNSARLARRNRNLGRRGTGVMRHEEGEVDERNRQANQPPAGPRGSTEPQPRPAAPDLDPTYGSFESQPRPATRPGSEHRP